MKKYKFIIVVVAWVAIVFAVNKLSAAIVADRTSYELPSGIFSEFRFTLLPFINFDGRNYLDIANQGYFQKGIYNLRSFFPLYPLAIKMFSSIFRINLLYSGFIISYLCTFASIFLIYEIAGREYDTKTAFYSVIALLTFPVSFYLLSFYTESLYLLLVLLFFWFLDKKKYLLATIFAALASATRIPGLVLAAILVYKAVQDYFKTKKIHWEVILSPLGFVGYCLYSYIQTGDSLIFLHSLNAWGRSFTIFGPILSIITGFKNVIAGPQSFFDSPFVYPISIIELISVLFLIAVIIFSYKKIKTEYWLYIVGSSYFYLAGGALQSLPRYLLVLFPIYIFVAKRIKGFAFIIYNILSGILLLFLSAIFLRGYWVA